MGSLGGAEFVLAMVADEQVLDYRFERRGKIWDGVDGARNGFDFHHDVAEELAFGGVADGALVAEFVEFADVVKHSGGEEQIEIELGVVSGQLLGEAAEADDVFEQAADVGVMHDFGGGRALVSAGRFSDR